MQLYTPFFCMVLLFVVMLLDHSLNLSICKKCVCMATFNDRHAVMRGPLAHTPPLFHKLKVLTI